MAHAWLRSGKLIVTGADTMDQYTVVGVFGKRCPEKGSGRLSMIHESELYSSGFPKELKLILSMIRGDLTALSPEELKAGLQGTDWQLFLRLVYHHRLYSVLYVKMKEFNSAIIPADVMESLRQQYTVNTFRMLHLTAEMEQVCGAFRERGIRNITLKGPKARP